MSETQHRRGAGDVPPDGEELDAEQKLRSSQEMGGDSEVCHDGKGDKQDDEGWLHGRVLSPRAAAVTPTTVADMCVQRWRMSASVVRPIEHVNKNTRVDKPMDGCG